MLEFILLIAATSVISGVRIRMSNLVKPNITYFITVIIIAAITSFSGTKTIFMLNLFVMAIFVGLIIMLFDNLKLYDKDKK